MHKNAQKMSEKLRAKFLATTSSCSVVKIGRLDDAFLEVLLAQACLVEGKSLQQKDKKRRKGKCKKIKKN